MNVGRMPGMRKIRWWWTRVCSALVCAALGFALAVAADFEVTGPDGRRILLKGDGTWRYVEGKGAAGEAPKEAEKEKPTVVGEAVLVMERRVDGGGGCIFGLRLLNSFTHPIQSFVPTFSALRSNDVAYHSVTAGFVSLKPGDSQSREVVFKGIPCQEVARLQVSGGDRCVMGDLDRFRVEEGACLKRVRVVPSALVRFDK